MHRHYPEKYIFRNIKLFQSHISCSAVYVYTWEPSQNQRITKTHTLDFNISVFLKQVHAVMSTNQEAVMKDSKKLIYV